VRVVVNRRVCELAIELWLLVVTTCKWSIIHLPIQTPSVITLSRDNITEKRKCLGSRGMKPRLLGRPALSLVTIPTHLSRLVASN
jgi:hypothetical protein